MTTLLSASQCAESLAISTSTWWRWHKEGRTPKKHQISTGRVAWRSDDIQKLIDRLAPPEGSDNA